MVGFFIWRHHSVRCKIFFLSHLLTEADSLSLNSSILKIETHGSPLERFDTSRSNFPPQPVKFKLLTHPPPSSPFVSNVRGLPRWGGGDYESVDWSAHQRLLWRLSKLSVFLEYERYVAFFFNCILPSVLTGSVFSCSSQTPISGSLLCMQAM